MHISVGNLPRLVGLSAHVQKEHDLLRLSWIRFALCVSAV